MDTRRYHGLDALRGVMMMLGIVIHAAVYYLAYPPVPIAIDASSSPVFDVLVVFIHSFRMPLFFVLAGFFASLLVEKYGVAGSYRNRARRVALPLLLGLLTIVPVTVWLTLSAFLTARAGEVVLLTSAAQLAPLEAEARALEEAGLRQEPSPVHLWFLYYLCYFYAPLPLYGAAVGWLTRSRWHALVERALASPWTVLAFGAATTLTLWPFRAGVVFGGFLYFTPHPPSLAYYGSFFALGYLFHTYRVVLETFQRHVKAFAVVSALLFPAALAATFWCEEMDPGSLAAHATAVVLNAFCTWSLIYLLTGIALRFFDFESPWIRFISQSSYWVYLIHMPVVGAFGLLMLPRDLSAFVKFPVLLAATIAVCFVSYQYLARRTWISVLLNGRRFSLDWPWRASGSPPS